MCVEYLGQPRIKLLAYEPGRFLQFGFHLQYRPANSLHFGFNLLRPDPNSLSATFQYVSTTQAGPWQVQVKCEFLETLFLARQLW